MNRETLIYGDKTAINTDFYLHLLSCEEREKRLIKYLEDKIKYIKSNYSQIGGNYFNMNCTIEAYQDILEKIKSGKYE